MESFLNYCCQKICASSISRIHGIEDSSKWLKRVVNDRNTMNKYDVQQFISLHKNAKVYDSPPQQAVTKVCKLSQRLQRRGNFSYTKSIGRMKEEIINVAAHEYRFIEMHCVIA